MNDAVSASSSACLVDRLAQDMARRWRMGERPVVEDYLRLHPALADQPEPAIELIYEELCLRQEHGEPAGAADVLGRFPQWRQQLRVVLECQQLLETSATQPHFPSPGEGLGDFRLVAELGRGTRGRVFLATQQALARRPVVLKLGPRWGHEHLALARLQHTHVVPLWSMHDDPARGITALCMPYFGGATLGRLLGLLQGRSLAERTGQHLLDALIQAEGCSPLALSVSGPACRFLAGSSWGRAICWMGICLAEGLQYVHERGLVHLDLKPSNVLWTADGQPMILDLHLAQGPIEAGAAPPACLGGTPAYMAPEQRLALAAVRAGHRVPATVDGRADVYALGLVLCEALSGALPPPGHAARWILQRNPQVSVGLADIVAKCLAEAPQARYPDAASLADDLRRHLSDRPLRGVRNRSWTERWRKWRRRPHVPGLLGPLLVILAAGGGLALIEGPGYRGRTAQGPSVQRQHAYQAEQAQELHRLAQRLRELAGVAKVPAGQLTALQAQCRAFWDRRDQVLRGLSAGPDRQQVLTDLLDLAALGCVPWAERQAFLESLRDAP